MIAFDIPAWIVLTYLFVMGCTVGSFLNVVVYRLPRSTTIWSGLKGLADPPSTCPKCGTRIKLRDNIPVLGWLLLRGRCRECGLKIAMRYPLVELANGLLWVALYWLEVPGGQYDKIGDSALATLYGPYHEEHPFLSNEWLVHLRYFWHLLLMELLLVAGLIDAETKTIPKLITDPFIVLGLLLSLIGGLYLLPVLYRPPAIGTDVAILTEVWTGRPLPAWLAAMYDGPPRPGWVDGFPGSQLHGSLVAIVGGLAGALPILFMRITGRWIYGREAMGLGDVYLMGLVGVFLGWQPTLTAIMLGSLIAAVSFLLLAIIGMRAEIPFGPFLAAGSALTVFAWPILWPRLESFFGLGPLILPLLGLLAVTFVVLAVLLRIVLHPLLCLIPGYRDDWYGSPGGEWTAADQNQFFQNSRIDSEPGLSGRGDWTGPAAASGFRGERDWRGE